MSFEVVELEEEEEPSRTQSRLLFLPTDNDRRYIGDRYRNHGQNLATSSVLKVLEYQKGLKGHLAKVFARGLNKQINKLIKKQVEMSNNLRAILPSLPEVLRELNVR